jgi:hypothetical protein
MACTHTHVINVAAGSRQHLMPIEKHQLAFTGIDLLVVQSLIIGLSFFKTPMSDFTCKPARCKGSG